MARKNWVEGGPILFYTGNEGDITWFANNTVSIGYWPSYSLMLKSSKPSILPTKLILKIRLWTLNQREKDHVCKRTPITRETRKSDVVQRLDKHASHTFFASAFCQSACRSGREGIRANKGWVDGLSPWTLFFFITQSGSYPILRFLLSPERESRVFCSLVRNWQNSLSPSIVTKTLWQSSRCDHHQRRRHLTLHTLTSVYIFSTLSPYICYGTDKENLFNNQERL